MIYENIVHFNEEDCETLEQQDCHLFLLIFQRYHWLFKVYYLMLDMIDELLNFILNCCTLRTMKLKLYGL